MDQPGGSHGTGQQNAAQANPGRAGSAAPQGERSPPIVAPHRAQPTGSGVGNPAPGLGSAGGGPCCAAPTRPICPMRSSPVWLRTWRSRLEHVSHTLSSGADHPGQPVGAGGSL